MKTFFLLKQMLLLGVLISLAITANLTGKWEGHFPMPDDDGNNPDISCTFTQKDSLLTGYMTGPDGTVDIINGKVSGKYFSYDWENVPGYPIHTTGKYYSDSITIDFTTSAVTFHAMFKRVQ